MVFLYVHIASFLEYITSIFTYCIWKYPNRYFLYYTQSCNNPKTLLVSNDLKSSASKKSLSSTVQRNPHPKSYF